MSWSVAYFESDRVTFRASSEHAWGALPVEGVLWVDVLWSGWGQRLAGRDYFWLDTRTRTFGKFNDPANREWYGGAVSQCDAWRYDEYGSHLVQLPDKHYLDVHVLAGVLLPNDVWEEVTRAYPLVLA